MRKCIFIADNDEYRHRDDQREGSTWWCDCPCCNDKHYVDPVDRLWRYFEDVHDK